MERIKVEEDRVKLSFNNDFYPQEFIDQATEDFSEECKVEHEGEWLVLIPKTEKPKTVGYEFYNYVLGLIKNQ